MSIAILIAKELNVRPSQVQATMDLLAEGATVPFIARYRKEATGGLDDTQLRQLHERLDYLKTLNARKQTVLNTINNQEKLTDDIRRIIDSITDKTALEDFYLPYKPKRRTKAQIAREAGLQPLAQKLLTSAEKKSAQLAEQYIDVAHGVATIEDALNGAQQILIEQFSEHGQLIHQLREKLWQEGELTSRVISTKAEEGDKFRDYFEYREKLLNIPSHRALAIFRAQKEGIVRVSLTYPEQEEAQNKLNDYEYCIAKAFNIFDAKSSNNTWLTETVKLAWRKKIQPSLSKELLGRLKERADEVAIDVFAQNLKDLLLMPPAGRLATIGLDPGIRTGVKVALIDDTGKVISTDTIFPFQPRNERQQSLATLAHMIKEYDVQLIAIGNGTASRETSNLVAELLHNYEDIAINKVIVSEAGASVYSASALAALELPTLDVSLRGAVSIARRLQDPLAELVKIEPKAIGIGQYQHDVNQTQLTKSLTSVVEDCVNAVGVDLNTASVALLTYVSGLNSTLAENIVAYRDKYGAFSHRKELLKVSRLGPKAFEQAAGFLRINGGKEPLDASAVHPEAYPVVEKILRKTNLSLTQLLGNRKTISQLQAQDFVDNDFGLPTVRDILKELEKPGRDPRGEFKTAEFDEKIHTIADLNSGMVLEGVISNVAHFGAFVDIGVHQDGLIHISEMAERYVQDPREIVKAGDVVKVRVLEVDDKRKRISLSLKKV